MSVQTIPKTRQAADMALLPLREVSALQSTKTISVGIQKPYGIPHVAFKLILNAHNRTLRDAEMGIPPARRMGETLVKRLASLRAPGRHASEDPLFWLLGVRRHLRQAALSHARLRSDQLLDDTYPTAQWATLNQVSVSALAAWAHRCWDCDTRLNSILLGLLNEGDCSTEYVIPNYATGNRCLWYLQARGIVREEAWDLLRSAGILPDWRTKVSTRPFHEKTL